MADQKTIGRIIEKAFIEIPDYVMRDRTLSILEVIVRYLKEDLGFNYHDIGVLLSRNERTIWTVYDRVKKKNRPVFYDMESAVVNIPTHIFKDRELSCLEVVVEYLKDKLELSLNDISNVIGRDYRTIWTICSRIKAKRLKSNK